MWGGGIVGAIGGFIGGVIVWIISLLGVFYYDYPVYFYDVASITFFSGFIGAICGIGTRFNDSIKFRANLALVLGIIFGGSWGLGMGETLISTIVHAIILALCFGVSGRIGILEGLYVLLIPLELVEKAMGKNRFIDGLLGIIVTFIGASIGVFISILIVVLILAFFIEDDARLDYMAPLGIEFLIISLVGATGVVLGMGLRFFSQPKFTFPPVSAVLAGLFVSVTFVHFVGEGVNLVATIVYGVMSALLGGLGGLLCFFIAHNPDEKDE